MMADRTRGVVALHHHGRPLCDNYGNIIMFKSREQAQWALGQMGHDVGGFTYHPVVGVESSWTKKYNQWVKQRRDREDESEG